jgi:hypothetical protein
MLWTTMAAAPQWGCDLEPTAWLNTVAEPAWLPLQVFAEKTVLRCLLLTMILSEHGVHDSTQRSDNEKHASYVHLTLESDAQHATPTPLQLARFTQQSAHLLQRQLVQAQRVDCHDAHLRIKDRSKRYKAASSSMFMQEHASAGPTR